MFFCFCFSFLFFVFVLFLRTLMILMNNEQTIFVWLLIFSNTGTCTSAHLYASRSLTTYFPPQEFLTWKLIEVTSDNTSSLSPVCILDIPKNSCVCEKWLSYGSLSLLFYFGYLFLHLFLRTLFLSRLAHIYLRLSHRVFPETPLKSFISFIITVDIVLFSDPKLF